MVGPGEQGQGGGSTPDVADALLAELEAGGELVGGEGRFTIDAGQARTKLRDYQLAEPEAYALLLVEAAVLGGAAPIEIESSASGLRLWLGPVAASRGELEQLFAAAFVDLEGVDEAEVRRRRVLQKLAFACNAALRLEPSAIIIESVGESEGVCLRLTPEAELGEVTDIDDIGDMRAGLSIRVAYAGLGLEQPPETTLLRERCKYASAPMILDGARLDRGQRHVFHVDFEDAALGFGDRGLKVRPVVLDGVKIGLAGFRYGGRAPAQLTILTHGVLTERLEFGGAERPAAPDFTAIVDVDLAKDLSQSRVLRGPAYDQVIAAVWAVHDAIAPATFGRPRTREPKSVGGFPGLALVPLVLGIAGFTAFGVAAATGNGRLENIAWLLLFATVVAGLAVRLGNPAHDAELDE